MKTSPNGYAVIKHYEQCRLKAYPDPKTGGAPWTVGWGETGSDIGPQTVWTQAQADERLIASVEERESDVDQAVRVPLTQGQYDAWVSALFNIGHGSPIKDGLVRLRSGYPSTFLRLTNAQDFDGARAALAQWVSPGSNVEHGLRRRRTAEMALWAGNDGATAIAMGDAA